MYCAVVDPVSNQYLILAASQPADTSTCGMVVLTGQEASAVMATAQPFDATLAAGFWSFALFFTLSAWLTAKYSGVFLSLLRR